MTRVTTAVLTRAKWIGTVTGISGALLIALNLGVVQYGFGLFLASSLLWAGVGLVQREPSLAVLQLVYIGINVLGLWRWLET